MLNENLKQLRRERGLSQEDMAAALNVVRQTVSKWESGRSVPDAVMLKRIAELLDTSVSSLLGEADELREEKEVLAEKLAALNEKLAEMQELRRRRRHRFFLISAGAVLVILLVTVFISLQMHPTFSLPMLFPGYCSSIGVIGGADGPTSVFVSASVKPWVMPLVWLILLAVLSAGVYKTK